MKILIVSTYESFGGAAIAAHRLVDALNRYGQNVHCNMLVRDKTSNKTDTVFVHAGKLTRKIKFAWERGVIWCSNHFGRNNLFAVSIANTGFDITGHPAFKDADIIHIHWTQHGMLSLHDMEKIFRSGKPVVWTLHDMWAFTGICHYADECTAYQEKCGQCPLCKGHLARWTFNKKIKLYHNRFNIITCSHWLQSKAQSGKLFAGKTVNCIANALDMDIFKPGDKLKARQKLGLPTDRHLVLFASQKVTDRRKGLDYLAEASRLLKKQGENLEFIVMGKNSDQITRMLSYKVHSMGYVTSMEQAATIYQAADLFVTPSLMDNLPNTIAEAMACGTPCVGFNIGGIPEMIDHRTNGYVANYKDAEDLASGIEWVLNHPDYNNLCRQAATKAVNTYSEEVVAQQYINLYKSLIHEKENN